ncbi:hypothetical protein RG47T_5191 [Mucilaginibacter polytrichastri]|uniref:Uncharacterized protein n=1 Tax=Mucilaginibacter polytrichastri TaxID=1302689 RepID=A0A1Q6A6T7_9SPHI|nr:hypothetical protein RG47T_5191 [Mucilaginibacter polytrichastri]
MSKYAHNWIFFIKLKIFSERLGRFMCQNTNRSIFLAVASGPRYPLYLLRRMPLLSANGS